MKAGDGGKGREGEGEGRSGEGNEKKTYRLERKSEHEGMDRFDIRQHCEYSIADEASGR